MSEIKVKSSNKEIWSLNISASYALSTVPIYMNLSNTFTLITGMSFNQNESVLTISTNFGYIVYRKEQDNALTKVGEFSLEHYEVN